MRSERKNGLTLVANWTLSKQVYQNGYNDIQQLVPRAQHLPVRSAAQRQVLGRVPAPVRKWQARS